jgi:hypothetical protein
MRGLQGRDDLLIIVHQYCSFVLQNKQEEAGMERTTLLEEGSAMKNPALT